VNSHFINTHHAVQVNCIIWHAGTHKRVKWSSVCEFPSGHLVFNRSSARHVQQPASNCQGSADVHCNAAIVRKNICMQGTCHHVQQRRWYDEMAPPHPSVSWWISIRWDGIGILAPYSSICSGKTFTYNQAYICMVPSFFKFPESQFI